MKKLGARSGDEVVKVFVSFVDSKGRRPKQALKAIKRVSLSPGELRRVKFTLPVRQLAYWDTTRHDFVVEPGKIELRVGAASDRIIIP